LPAGPGLAASFFKSPSSKFLCLLSLIVGVKVNDCKDVVILGSSRWTQVSQRLTKSSSCLWVLWDNLFGQKGSKNQERDWGPLSRGGRHLHTDHRCTDGGEGFSHLTLNK
jgi:hypothetical protein